LPSRELKLPCFIVWQFILFKIGHKCLDFARI
jgi:hypothetical protein